MIPTDAQFFEITQAAQAGNAEHFFNLISRCNGEETLMLCEIVLSDICGSASTEMFDFAATLIKETENEHEILTSCVKSGNISFLKRAFDDFDIKDKNHIAWHEAFDARDIDICTEFAMRTNPKDWFESGTFGLEEITFYQTVQTEAEKRKLISKHRVAEQPRNPRVGI